MYKLNKTLYDFKQVTRDLYDIIDHHLLNDGFNSNNEPTFYIEGNQQGNILILCLYVDSMIYTKNMSLNAFKSTMKNEFEMKNLGLTRYFFGIKVEQYGIFIS